MEIGGVFGDSLNDTRRSFWSFALFILVFSVLPVAVLFVIFYSITGSFEFVRASPLSWYFVLSTLISAISSIVIYAGGISSSFGKEKISYNLLVNNGLSNFRKYFVAMLVLFIFLIGLFILLIIPGIIFVVYWVCALYILFAEKKGIRASLKTSRQLVKGKWWRVFGYILLFGVCMSVISIIANILTLPFIDFNGIVKATQAGTQYVSPIGYSIAMIFANLLVGFVLTPFQIFFGKYLYLGLKAEKK